MEDYSETRQNPEENIRSLDICASVNLLRYDLDHSGDFHDRTIERVYDEELSFITEGIDRSSRTKYHLKREAGQIVIFHEGEWIPYLESLEAAVEKYEAEAKLDPRRVFLYTRAQSDKEYGHKLNNLRPGEKLTWYSPYPHKEAEACGESFIEECGFNSERKMGFIYQAVGNEDGTVTLESQTIDLSDEYALNEAMSYLEIDPEADLDTITLSYDYGLMERYGGHFFAGRREAKQQEDTWQIIKAQGALVDYHINELKIIAKSDLQGEELEKTIRAHYIGSWSLFKANIDKYFEDPAQVVHRIFEHTAIGADYDHVAHETIRHFAQQATANFIRNNQQIIICGGSISGGDLSGTSRSDLLDGIFGESYKTNSSSRYKFDKIMFCRKCQRPPQSGAEKKACGPCGLCVSCDIKAGGKGLLN